MMSELSKVFAICPYCKHNHSPHLSKKVHQATASCSSCGKKFFLTIRFKPEIITTPDCELNGGTHDYSEWATDTTDLMHRVCSTCGVFEMSKRGNDDAATIQGESASG